MLEATPGAAQFGRAFGIVEGRGIENGAVDRAEHVRERDLGGCAGQKIAAFLAAHAASNALRLEFDQNLDEVVRRNVLIGREIFDAQSVLLGKMPGEAENGTSRVVAFDRQFHLAKFRLRSGDAQCGSRVSAQRLKLNGFF